MTSHPRVTHADVFEVRADRAADVTQVMCESFRDYPVMRYIVGADSDDYDSRLHALVDFFVRSRFFDGSPVLAVETSGVMTAAATLTAPGAREEPADLAVIRNSLWAKLGEPARARYAGLCDIWGRFWLHEPHVHVNMIGVLSSHQGSGYARVLLDFIHSHSDANRDSRGTSLTTEKAANVTLYEHFGYQVTGHEKFAPDLETWGMFRKRETT